MKGTGRYTCKDCDAQLGYRHYPSCMQVGVVVSTQCNDSKAEEPAPVLPAPLCKCNHRSDHHGLNSKGPTACHYQDCPCMEYRPMNRDDEIAARTEDDTIHMRAARIARELRSETPLSAVTPPRAVTPKPNILVVNMPDEAPATSEAVLQAIVGSAERVSLAEIVIGVWANGHMHVGKNRYGPDGPIEPEQPRVSVHKREWPRKLIWGVWREPGGGTGVIHTVEDIPDPGVAESEPYIPTRNLLGALEAQWKDAERAIKRHGGHGVSPMLDARKLAFAEAIELVEAEVSDR